MPHDDDQASLRAHLQEHIDLIAKHEQEFLANRTRSERLSDRMAAFIGSLRFVGANLFGFALWIGWNALRWRMLPRFDPPPFELLALFLALEAILVASFILMRQSRMSRRSEERDHLMLQVLLLTERELTALMGMERQVAGRMGMAEIADGQEVTQMSQETSIDEVAQILRETLPAE